MPADQLHDASLQRVNPHVVVTPGQVREGIERRDDLRFSGRSSSGEPAVTSSRMAAWIGAHVLHEIELLQQVQEVDLPGEGRPRVKHEQWAPASPRRPGTAQRRSRSRPACAPSAVARARHLSIASTALVMNRHPLSRRTESCPHGLRRCSIFIVRRIEMFRKFDVDALDGWRACVGRSEIRIAKRDVARAPAATLRRECRP